MRLTSRISWILGGAALAVVAGVCAVLWSRHQAAVKSVPAEVALGHRVTVEVLNTTKASGLARVVRDIVRHAGLDVVYYGSVDTTRTHNEVLVRRGDTTGVGRIIEALGAAVVTDAPDRAREVDLTVLIGTDYLQSKPASRP